MVKVLVWCKLPVLPGAVGQAGLTPVGGDLPAPIRLRGSEPVHQRDGDRSGTDAHCALRPDSAHDVMLRATSALPASARRLHALGQRREHQDQHDARTAMLIGRDRAAARRIQRQSAQREVDDEDDHQGVLQPKGSESLCTPPESPGPRPTAEAEIREDASAMKDVTTRETCIYC